MGSSDGKLYAFAGAVDFTADHPSGGAPLAVQFTGISPLTVTTWSWDFGDGTTSTEQNPSHTFISVGSFTVNLTITHHDGTNYLSRTAYINVYAPPVACFSTNPTTGKAPVIIQFTDESTGIPTAWFWDFGDGDSTNATVQNPVHRYSLPETYTINLTVTNPAGSNTSSKVKYITVISPLVPVANFTSDVTSGKSPLTVQFTDQSTSAPASWLWDFGDGTTSDEQNPTHSYSTTGTDTVTYTVNLTATNSAGSNTTSKTNYITLYSNPPTVSFIATPRISTTAPLTVQFHDTTILSPTSWLWDFGDGDNTNATVQNPVHTYATAGTYTVNLTATNAIGSSTASRPGFITFVTQAPIAYNGANIYVSNDEGVKYDNNGTSLTYIPNTYGFAMAGGLNALSLSDTTKDIIINTRNQSGTFYAAFGGGQSTMPEGILLLAVKEPIPDDFGVRIRSSGYNWTPPGPAMYNGGLPAEYNYLDGAVNQTFTKNDFIYGPQIWRPCSAANYPIYNGQDMSNTGDTFQIMFIDLNVGAVGSFEDGLIKIEYNFTNLTSFAAFDVYGWYLASNHGTGIIMTNDISKSSYMVTGIPAAPVADFTSSTISADVISPVQFTDTSANVPQSWYWEFGDGTTSALQNPTHTYSTPNTYTVNLTVINYKGTDKVAKTGYITKIIPPVPIADFTANTTSGTYPLPVQFTDASANTPSSWSWDFGDGTTSTEKNPVHWFGSGTFTVNLTVTNSGGTNSIVKNNFVTVASSGSTNRFLNPGFETGDLTGWTGGATYTSVSSTHTHSGSDAVFFDYTGGSTYTYVAQRIDLTNVTNISFWGYQDNSFPLTQYFYTYIDGVMVYSSQAFSSTSSTWTQFTVPISGYTGVHQVQVIFLPSGKSVNSYIDDFVAEPGSSGGGGTTPPTAAFTATPVNGVAPLAVTFNDTSTNTPTGWLWDFGDSSTSTLKNPSHTYNSAGTYTVNLTATNAAGSNSSVQTGYITVTSGGGPTAPTASFTASTTSGPAPLAVTFTDTSTGSPTSWSWTFGDGGTSADKNPSHTYSSAGTYTVTLTATNAGGSTSSSKTITVKSGSLGVLPGYTGIYVRPSNANGILWNANGNGTYYINPNGGGINAVHITTDPAVNAGQVTVTPNTAGTFYLTDSGGRGYQDEAVLLLAVNGTIPDDFSVHIKTSGYTWTPNAKNNTAPPIGTEVYRATALDETFTKSDFLYGPQTWRPQGNNAAYPIYYGEDMSDTADNQYHIMFIDTRAGLLGSGTNGGASRDVSTLTNRGAVRVDYNFNDLQTYASFNLYAWNNATTQGQGMGWTNALTGSNTSSGYSVVGSAVPVPPTPVPPVASFTANVTSGPAPLAVIFTDTSTNTPTSWLWDFGDTTNATAQNPLHIYTTAGTYTVSLTATNAAGSTTAAKSGYINVTAAGIPVASFTANVTSGSAPLTVRFTDASTNDPTSWLWDFGDGNTSTVQNPVYAYTTAGTYTVNLTATNSAGSNTITRAGYINVTAAGIPVASFTANVTSGSAPLTVRFTDASTNDPTSWLWDFGDGGTAASRNPVHAYTTAGTYTVNLTATNGKGANTLTRAGYINVTAAGAPVASFTANVTSGSAPLSVQFTDASTNNPTSWLWDFGDGGTAASRNPVHAYTTAGTYTVNLTATNGKGANTLTRAGYINVTAAGAPVASFTANVTSGSAPLAVQFTDASTNNPTSWLWDFGDGGTSASQNPVHAYTTAGTYTVNLTATNAAGSTTAAKSGYITVTASGIPVASFTANVTSGSAPLSVKFTDASTNNPTSWLWDFGDGDTAASQNPTHTYSSIGTYTVNLTATNSKGANTLTQAGYITVTAVGTPVVSFTATPVNGLAPLTARFTDTSTNTPTSWLWTFGEGNTSTVQNPVYTYSSVGTYTVTLTATNSAGSNTITRPGYITVSAPVATTNNFTITGVQTDTGNATQNVTIDTTQVTASTSGNVVTLTNVSSAWDHLAITLEETPSTNGTTLTGTVSSVQAVTQPVTVPIPSLGNPSTTLTLDLTQLPNTGSSISSTISSDPLTSQQSSFTLAATNAGEQIDTIAYTVVFTKTGISNSADGGIITNATMSMAVSPSWVAAHGGTGHMVIMHREEDGTTTLLSTTFVGTDAAGNYLFTAVSPTGLSTFVLAALSPISPTPTSTPTPTPTPHYGHQAVGGGQPSSSDLGYTGPAPTQATLAPTKQKTTVSSSVTPSHTFTIPPLPTNTPRSGLDALPVLGALGLCGAIFLFRKNGK